MGITPGQEFGSYGIDEVSLALAADVEAGDEDKTRLNMIFGFEMEETINLGLVLDDAN